MDLPLISQHVGYNKKDGYFLTLADFETEARRKVQTKNGNGVAGGNSGNIWAKSNLFSGKEHQISGSTPPPRLTSFTALAKQKIFQH